MNKNTLTNIGVILALVISITTLVAGFSGRTTPFGGTTADYIDTAQYVDAAGGFRINGTEVIGSTGDIIVGDLTYGNSSTSIGTASSTTITAAQACDYQVLESSQFVDGIVGGKASTTLPSASALTEDCLADNLIHEIYFRNANTNPASTTDIVAGTGITLLGSNASSSLRIIGGSGAWIRFIQLNASTVIATFSNVVDID